VVAATPSFRWTLNSDVDPADDSTMQVEVVWLGFIFGIGAFAAWLVPTLRREHILRLSQAEQKRARITSYRHAARSARSVAVPVTTTRVVRAGSFCRVAGSVGRSKHGAMLVCSPMANSRPRWRRVDASRAA
jgi:hypothetical protein